MNKIKQRVLRATALGALVVCALLVAGCATTPPTIAAPPQAPDPALVLQAGDVIDVKFLYWSELDDQQPIRPDGKISLQMVGEVQAEGLTPEQLRTQLLTAYKDKITDPEINVVVRSLDSHRVYIGGEVKAPGMVMIQGRLTVLGAIMQVGGFNKASAKLANVVVIRQRDGKQYAQSLDLRKALQDPQSEPFYLQPFDVVYVPRTQIDRLDQWVDQYINQIVPRNLHYTFSQNVSQQKVQNESLQVPITIGAP